MATGHAPAELVEPRPALVIVDCINAYADPDLLGGGSTMLAIENCVALVARMRAQGVPIAFVRTAFAADLADAGPWCEKVPALKVLTEGAAASALVADLIPGESERVLAKQAPSAFFGTDLASEWIAHGIDTVIVAGCTTSGAVRATAVDALSFGFGVVVLSDCVGDAAADVHAANLADLDRDCATVLDAETLLARLGAQGVAP